MVLPLILSNTTPPLFAGLRELCDNDDEDTSADVLAWSMLRRPSPVESDDADSSRMTASTPNSPKESWPAPSPPASPSNDNEPSTDRTRAPSPPSSRKLPPPAVHAPKRPHKQLGCGGASMDDGLEQALLSTASGVQAGLFHDLSALFGMEADDNEKEGCGDLHADDASCGLPGLLPLPAPPDFSEVSLHGASSSRLPLLGGLAQLTGLVALPGHDQPTSPLSAPLPLAAHALKRWRASPQPAGGSMSNAAAGGGPAQWPLAATRWKVAKRPPSAPPAIAPAPAPPPPRAPPNKAKGPSKKGSCVWKAAITL